MEDIEKYQPIICSTIRGMGKTAFMEAVGMQLVKSDLENKRITEALAYGRILLILLQAVSKLVKLISFNDENKTIFSAQDSMDDINLKDSILKLNIKSLNGVPNLLYSEEIYDHEKEIEIEMPIDRLVKIVRNVIVMIGVSGCGKTRTCYDLCRKDWGLYFDCTVDVDFITMIAKLEVIRPRFKTEESQQIFEEESKRLIECLIAARLLVLKTLKQRNRNLECFEWLCIQRSRRSLSNFHCAMSTPLVGVVSHLPAIERRGSKDCSGYIRRISTYSRPFEARLSVYKLKSTRHQS